jgi:glycosyltransferase involved in cell wall biosynthesis
MRVGIDATVAAQPQITGIGRLIRNLVDALARTDVDAELTLFYRLRSLKHPRTIWRPRDARFRVRFLGGPLDRWTLNRLDVFHSTYQRLPRVHSRVPYLGTLHDIYFATRAADVDSVTSERWVARYRDVVQRSRLIMTLSEYSKREIVVRLGADPDRIRVVLPAASDVFERRAASEVHAVRQRYGLGAAYVLFAGGIDLRKNPAGALRAFARAAGRLPTDVCLAVAGAGEAGADLHTLIPPTLRDRVRFLGFVPDDDFAALMSGCTVFFFPTLLEGFGLPALEAMACGAAVVTSSTTSLPEVCGEAALLIDPEDDAAMADALVRVVEDAALRAELQRKGIERAARFSWSRTALQTLELYREIAGGPSP